MFFYEFFCNEDFCNFGNLFKNFTKFILNVTVDLLIPNLSPSLKNHRCLWNTHPCLYKAILMFLFCLCKIVSYSCIIGMASWQRFSLSTLPFHSSLLLFMCSSYSFTIFIHHDFINSSLTSSSLFRFFLSSFFSFFIWSLRTCKQKKTSLMKTFISKNKMNASNFILEWCHTTIK